MEKLSADFKFSRYGIDVRFAQIEDSQFLLDLRTSKRGEILHPTDASLEHQIEWMKEYKKREADGLDYYFIYSRNGKDFGVNRITDIDYANNSCSCGSWICSADAPFEDAIATAIIAREIEFDILKADFSVGYTKKTNKQIQRWSDFLGSEKTGETETDIYYRINREQYKLGNERVVKLLGFKD